MKDQAESDAMRCWVVPAALTQIRVDAFARRCLPHLSRHSLVDAFNENLFRVNGRTARKGEKLKSGDRLSFHGTEPWLLERPPANAAIDVPIVFEDDALLVLNKPAGMPTHGFSGRDRTTLANFLAARRPQLLSVGKSRWEPGLVHRLDRDTSGLVLVAKTPRVFEQLRAQFEARRVQKRYCALVWGVTADEGSITYPLAHDPRDAKRIRAIMQPRESTAVKSWQAVTLFRKVSTAHGLTLLDIEMKTGVMHQLRVHFAAMGHPILGDRLYGAPEATSMGLQRHFLHAAGLEFDYPEQARRVTIEAELPSELRDVLKSLGMQ